MAAIYQWFDFLEEEYTTTLYPVEVVELLEFTCELEGGGLYNIIEDEVDINGNLLSAELYQILISTTSPYDDADIDGDLLSADLYQILISTTSPYDNADINGDLLDCTLLDLLVIVDTPDESLQLDMELYPSGCSMTDV
jgi:hypothetical protein